MRPPSAAPLEPTAELQEACDNFGALQSLWLAYKAPCSKENCPICQSKSDGKQGKEDDQDDEDDEDDDDEDDDRNKENGEEDEESSEDISSSGKSRKRISRRQPDSPSQQTPLRDDHAKKSTGASKHRKKRKNTERDWMTSAPYDESIPYTHRYGYTWAGTTSTELMELWQVYRKPVDY